ncbi:S1 family peptidase [Glaciecola sp. 1036]|uniref:S1 family peptidase n=1 Tax=Alteromonadaceae TaxID=72275 RepID=UPI003D013382
MLASAFLWSIVSHAEENEAELLFDHFAPALVQIKSINNESNQKSSIGTGFFVEDSGYLVTNYHVVASAVQSPEQYSLEYIDHDEQTHEATLIDVDIVNDLAILYSTQKPSVYFSLGSKAPAKGADVYSLGNPHDLGMIVVPGTYNGIKSKSYYERVNLTGSLNPGMSGGPTVSTEGQVIGVNVSTAGNQLSFLVPIEKLTKLFADALQLKNNDIQNKTLIARIQQQLFDNQTDFISRLHSSEWSFHQVGEVSIPKEMGDIMHCWGDSNKDQEKTQFIIATTNCSLESNVYIYDNFRTGSAKVSFRWIQSEKLNALQLANVFENNLKSSFFNMSAGKDDVSSYHCQESIFANNNNNTAKGVSCIRAYRKFHSLFDVKFSTILLQDTKQTLVAEYALNGVSQDMANMFFKKFVDSIKWN